MLGHSYAKGPWQAGLIGNDVQRRDRRDRGRQVEDRSGILAGSASNVGLVVADRVATTCRMAEVRGRKELVEYEETYQGQRIIITTLQQTAGGWTARAELLHAGRRIPVASGPDERYPSDEAARQAALSLAAGAIDRSRISGGKP